MSHIIQNYNSITRPKSNIFFISDVFLLGYYGFLVILIIIIFYFVLLLKVQEAILLFQICLIVSILLLSLYIFFAEQYDYHNRYLQQIDKLAIDAKRMIENIELPSNDSIQDNLIKINLIQEQIRQKEDQSAKLLEQHDNIRVATIDNEINTLLSYKEIPDQIIAMNQQINHHTSNNYNTIQGILSQQEDQKSNLKKLYELDQKNNIWLNGYENKKIPISPYDIDISNLNVAKPHSEHMEIFGYVFNFQDNILNNLYCINPMLSLNINKSYKELLDSQGLYKTQLIKNNNFIHNNQKIYANNSIENSKLDIDNQEHYSYIKHQDFKILYDYAKNICIVLFDRQCYIANDQGVIYISENNIAFNPFGSKYCYLYKKSSDNIWNLSQENQNIHDKSIALLKQFIVKDNNNTIIYNNWNGQERLRLQSIYQEHKLSEHAGMVDLIITTPEDSVILTIDPESKQCTTRVISNN